MGIWFNFHWKLFLRVQRCQYYSIGSDDGLAPIRRQAIIWNNYGIVYWRINAPLGLNQSSRDLQRKRSFDGLGADYS